MAEDDVIELGSSDEETEPAAKKAKPNKPNVMVQIPGQLRDITITPTTKPNFTPSLKQNQIGRLVKTQIQPLQNLKNNAIKIRKCANVNKLIATNIQLKNDIVINKVSKPATQIQRINPISVMGIPHGTQLSANKVSFNVQKARQIIAQKLPPGITIKKAVKPSACQTRRPPIKKLKTVPEVLTVELDDDEAISEPAPGPQWYIKPEEQSNKNKLEQENNAEPDSKNVLEITIEDSPVKPVASKRRRELSTEQAITIDDSPIKPGTEKSTNDSGDETTKITNPHSKKKLEYPKETPTMEIEIDMTEMVSSNVLECSKKDVDNVNAVSCTDKVEKSEAREDKKDDTCSVDADVAKSKMDKELDSKTEVMSSKTGEFHPVYQQFIDLCFKLEDSEDMKKIVEKKIKTYYRQVPKIYTESEEFIEMVSSKLIAMKAGPEKMYLYIKDIVDELNLQRKIAKNSGETQKETATENVNISYGEDNMYDSSKRRQVRKLEKTLKKLHRAIQKLEEQEVDFDDEDDSVYLLTERYKERMVRVHAKFCQLTNTKMPSEPYIRIEARPGQPVGPIKRLEKWINKKVPIGTPLPFPDFHDVLRCVRDANQEDRLGWNEMDIMEQARDLFSRCGKKLQRRRQENEWRLAFSRISTETDPAEASDVLKKKLDENKDIAAKKETEILNKYVDRQNQLKLEGEEIADKEVDESPVDTDDEPNEETDSLENKEKRKERLKRLLQEKSMSKALGKENVISIEEEKEEIVENQENVSDVKKTTGDEKDVPKLNDTKTDNVETACDDNKNLDSDMDELHLLQKLHSESEAIDTSDSASLIAISDTLESNTDSPQNTDPEVISIENSSYSESECKCDKESTNQIVKEVLNADIEIECHDQGVSKQSKSNGSEDDDVIAYSDEDNDIINKDIHGPPVDCINLGEESIFIGETIIEGQENRNCNDDTEKQDNREISGTIDFNSETKNLEDGNFADNIDSVESVEIGLNSGTKTSEDDNFAENIDSVESVEIELNSGIKTSEDSNFAEHIDLVESVEVDLKSGTKTLEDGNFAEQIDLVESVEVDLKSGTRTLEDGNFAEHIDSVESVEIDSKSVTKTSEDGNFAEHIDSVESAEVDLNSGTKTSEDQNFAENTNSVESVEIELNSGTKPTEDGDFPEHVDLVETVEIDLNSGTKISEDAISFKNINSVESVELIAEDSNSQDDELKSPQSLLAKKLIENDGKSREHLKIDLSAAIDEFGKCEYLKAVKERADNSAKTDVSDTSKSLDAVTRFNMEECNENYDLTSNSSSETVTVETFNEIIPIDDSKNKENANIKKKSDGSKDLDVEGTKGVEIIDLIPSNSNSDSLDEAMDVDSGQEIIPSEKTPETLVQEMFAGLVTDTQPKVVEKVLVQDGKYEKQDLLINSESSENKTDNCDDLKKILNSDNVNEDSSFMSVVDDIDIDCSSNDNILNEMEIDCK